jgi:signal transduction histidine kinase
MSAPERDEQAPDLVSYSRRLGSLVTLGAAVLLTLAASWLVRAAVLTSTHERELAKVEGLRALHPLPADRRAKGASTEPLRYALGLWCQQAGWMGAVYHGRADARPVWVPQGAPAAMERPLTELDADRAPALLEAGEGRVYFVARLPLSADLAVPETLVILQDARDLPGWLRTMYALIFGVIAGSMGLLFAALLTVVGRGESLRRSALERAEVLRRAHSEAEAMLNQAAKMSALGELAAGVSHEINNPVAVVRNALEILAEHPALTDPDLKQGLADIEEAAERIRGIVKSLSTFSKPQASAFGPLRLAPLVHRTIELARLSAPRNPVTFRVDIAADLPEVMGQDGPLSQVFLNLLNNARHAVLKKAAEAGPGFEPLVVVRAVAVDDKVRIEVEDNGTGISPEHLARVFEPFFTTKPRWEGTGLGCWVTHRIVTAHGGTIRVASTPGRGTTFLVELMAAPAATSDGTASRAVAHG